MKTFVLWYSSWSNNLDVPVWFQARDLSIATRAGRQVAGSQFLYMDDKAIRDQGSYLYSWQEFCHKFGLYD